MFSNVSVVGADDCDASIALMGQSGVLSTVRPRNRSLPHTCWMNFLVLASTNGADDFCVAYCFFAPYCIGALGFGACCNFLTLC